MWIVMRQAHFDDEPTIDTDILDAFQRYLHSIGQTKVDIKALAERLEMAATAALAAEGAVAGVRSHGRAGMALWRRHGC